MCERLYGPFVINLESRQDRLNAIQAEFNKLTMTFTCLKATEGNPVLGCIDSHCRCLEQFINEPIKEAIFICEDDAQFNVDKNTLNKHINDFLDSDADAFCLGFYASNAKPWSNLFYRSNDIQTRVAYIVKPKLAKELLHIWRKLYSLIVSNPEPDNWYKKLYNNLPIKNKAKDIYRGDQIWKLLQQKYCFIIPKFHMVIQRPSFSNIENKFVDYKV